MKVYLLACLLASALAKVNTFKPCSYRAASSSMRCTWRDAILFHSSRRLNRAFARLHQHSDRHAPGITKSAICVRRFDDSLNSAIHTTYRSWLRSSSMHEPRDPPLKVIINFRVTNNIS